MANTLGAGCVNGARPDLWGVRNEEPYRAHASIWMQVKVLQGEGLTNHSLPLVWVANREVMLLSVIKGTREVCIEPRKDRCRLPMLTPWQQAISGTRFGERILERRGPGPGRARKSE